MKKKKNVFEEASKGCSTNQALLSFKRFSFHLPLLSVLINVRLFWWWIIACSKMYVVDCRARGWSIARKNKLNSCNEVWRIKYFLSHYHFPTTKSNVIQYFLCCFSDRQTILLRNVLQYRSILKRKKGKKKKLVNAATQKNKRGWEEDIWGIKKKV